MIDHLSLHVSNHDRSKTFYTKVLKPLGYAPLTQGEGYTGFGAEGWSDLWISGDEKPEPIHVAFKAPDHDTVHRVYELAMEAGARDNGKPGPRDYTPTYYAAFFFDPDGHNIEIVDHGKE